MKTNIVLYTKGRYEGEYEMITNYYKKCLSIRKTGEKFGYSHEWVRVIIHQAGIDPYKYRRLIHPPKVYIPKKICYLRCVYCKFPFTLTNKCHAKGMHNRCYRMSLYYNDSKYRLFSKNNYWKNKPKYQKYNKSFYIRRKYKELFYLLINYFLIYG